MCVHVHLQHCKLFAYTFVCLDRPNSTLCKPPMRTFDDSQRSFLKQLFAKDQYPTQDTIRNLSDVLEVDIKKVYKWFRVQRTKLPKGEILLTTTDTVTFPAGFG